MSEAARLAHLAAAYLERILAGDREGALRHIVEQVERGLMAEELLAEVVAPTHAELRRRSITGALSAEQVRHGQVVHDRVLALLRPPVFTDLPPFRSDG